MNITPKNYIDYFLCDKNFHIILSNNIIYENYILTNEINIISVNTRLDSEIAFCLANCYYILIFI